MAATTTLDWIDYAIIIASLVVSVAIGAYFAKRQSSSSQYFVASGHIPSWAIAMSIFATLISSVTFLAYPGSGFGENWILLVQGIMAPIVILASIWFVVPMFRHVIGLSAYEYFEKRFGYFARLYGSLGFIFAHFSKMGSVFFLVALAISGMTGVDTYSLIIMLGIAIVILTLLGGMEAVIWLDVVQGTLLILGGVIALAVIVLKTDGGFETIISIAAANDKMSLGSFDWDFVHLTFWVMAINGIFYAIQKYGTDQTIVQRYLTAKSDRDAIKASITGILLVVPVWTLFMFIGTGLYAFYQSGAATLPEGIRPDAVFPYFIMNEMPVGVVGLIIAALMSAAISSLDADLNCLAAIGVDDYYKRLRPGATDAQTLRMGKILVVLSGLGAMAVACIYVNLGGEGVLGMVFALYAIFSGGIAGMFLLGILVPRANWQGLYIGIAACVVFTAGAVLTSTKFDISGQERLLLDLGAWNFAQHKYMLGVYSHVVLFVVGWAASYLFPSKNVDPRLTVAGWLGRRNTDEALTAPLAATAE